MQCGLLIVRFPFASYNRKYSLVVFLTSVQSLGLVSLESIENGDVIVQNNSRLCYMGNIPWDEILRSSDQGTTVRYNMPRDYCGTWTAL